MAARAMTWGHRSGLPEPASREEQRPGQDVPGYTGYVPGKVPEMDIVGGTFAKVNDYVAEKPRTFGGPLGVKSVPVGMAPSPRTDAFIGAGVPGYTGYIPGKQPEADAFGKTFADMNAHVLVHGRPPTGRGHGPWEAAPPPKNADVARAREKVPGVAHAMVSIPGYSGFVPAKTSENVHGHGFAPANQKAAKEFHKVTYRQDGTERQTSWRRATGPGVEDRRNQGAGPGIGIPGYSGHAPGKKPEADMMGMTFAEVNKHADYQHRVRRGKVPQDGRHLYSGHSCPPGRSNNRGAQYASRSTASGSYASDSFGSYTDQGRSIRSSQSSGRPRTAPSYDSSGQSYRGHSSMDRTTRRPASARAPASRQDRGGGGGGGYSARYASSTRRGR